MERAGHVYSRISNPTNAVLEERIAALEGGVAGIAVAALVLGERLSPLQLAGGTVVLLAVGVLLGAGLVVPALLGYERYVIVSGSMSGTYDRGSIVFDRVVPTASLRAGDVITFTPPGDTATVRNEYSMSYGYNVDLIRATQDSINTSFVDMVSGMVRMTL